MSDTRALTNLALQAVRAAEAAAVAASDWIGRGEKESADQAAVDALRNGLKACCTRRTPIWTRSPSVRVCPPV